jgi:hypothetical protein
MDNSSVPRAYVLAFDFFDRHQLFALMPAFRSLRPDDYTFEALCPA